MMTASAQPRLSNDRPILGSRLRAKGALSRFWREEHGMMTPLVLVMVFLMLILGGISVDVMRFEARRVSVQNTLDRATLAAANMYQIYSDSAPGGKQAQAEAIVRDYFSKAQIESTLGAVHLIDQLNRREVTADASVRSTNFFMDTLGIPYLGAQNLSVAEQQITDIEVMLVLDVSGSMSGAKLTNLKTAANSFVDQLKNTDTENRISIGIVPYNAQVNLGSRLSGYFSKLYNHGNPEVNCFEIPSDLFTTTAIPLNRPLPMMAWADANSSTSTNSGTSITKVDTSTAWCYKDARNHVTLPTKNAATAKSAINNLQAGGNTSIVLGMRWGVGLLDPEARPIYTSEINGGRMARNMQGLPLDYRTRSAAKVIVLMTDGEHVAHNRVHDAYKTGNSSVYRSTDGIYSYYYDKSGSNDYWIPSTGKWQSSAAGKSPTRLTWQEVWAAVPVSWVAAQLHARGLSNASLTNNVTNTYNSKMNEMRGTWASASQMDSWLSQNCAAARDQRILIYGIAFQAPAGGQAAIRSCVSNPVDDYYFNVTQTERIKQAFETIAAHLSQLRLTQ